MTTYASAADVMADEYAASRVPFITVNILVIFKHVKLFILLLEKIDVKPITVLLVYY